MPGTQHDEGGGTAGKRPELTAAQREAVEHAGGPLIVLAGPGTGKTRVIVERIAHLVNVRRVDPASILSITFTNKAADEMRQRLATALADGGRVNRADQVRTLTSHSFGREVVHRFADVLGFGEPPQMIDAPVTRRVLRELARERGSFAELPSQGRDGAVKRTASFIGQCRNGNVTAERAVAYAKEWKAKLEARRDAQSVEDDAFVAEEGLQREFEQGAALYLAFESECHRRGWITMDELIALPIKLLRENTTAAAIVRQECRVVLFDEFQDANLAQIELLRRLCPPKSSPELCVVGDDDQAIYRFRGADDRGFERFRAIWGVSATGRDVAQVKLEENYRSHDPIVRLAGVVMKHAPHRFDPDKKLRVAEAKPEHLKGPVVEVVELAKDAWTRDAEMVTASIMADRKLAEVRGETARALSKTAVITRSGKDAERIAMSLRLEGIPCRVRAKTKLFDDPGVLDVIGWINLLTVPGAWWEVSQAMCRAPIGLSATSASELRRMFDGHVSELSLDDEGAEEKLHTVAEFVAWMRASVAKLGEAGAAVQRFIRLYDRLLPFAQGVNADEAVLEIVAAVGTPFTELLPAADRAGRVRSLAKFMAYVRSRLGMLATPGDLGALREYVDDMEDRDEGVSPEERVSEQETGEGEDVDDAVQLLTAHGSKGLEYDTVYVPRVGEHGYNTSPKGSDSELPTGLLETHELEPVAEADRDAAEARRVFYVACTRAERKLVLIAPVPKSVKTASSAVFYREITAGAAEELKDRVVVLKAEDVLRAAHDAGVTMAMAGAFDDGLSESLKRATRRVILDQARRAARRLAGAALEDADDAALTEDGRRSIAARMNDSARMLQAAAAVEAGKDVAEVVAGASDDVKVFALRLQKLSIEAPADQDFESVLLVAPKAPLRLSHTKIADYFRCPRCYYIKYELKFPDSQSNEQLIGQAAHAALEKFYRRWRDADANGGSLPKKDDLLRLGREQYQKLLIPGLPADRHILDDLLTLLGRVMDKLHDPEAHILDLEKYVEFPFEHGGHRHVLSAKLDRIEQRPSGGYRIVDYKTGGIDPKTGEASKKFAEPLKDDMQMALYAMALPHLFGDGQIAGEAQYWVLGAGVRGTIDFSAMKLDKVRERVAEAIDGILAGRFAPSEKCEGLCRRLGLDGVGMPR